MQSSSKGLLSLNYQALAKKLQQLLDQKVIDLFIIECEKLIDSGINLRQFSAFYKLDFDLEVQYRSIKRLKTESERLINLSYQPDEGWKNIQIDKNCTMAVKCTGTIMQLKSRGVLDVQIKNVLIMAYLMKLYTECFPFCKQAFDIKQPTKLQKIGFIRLSLPIPFIKDRSTLLKGTGFQLSNKPHKVFIFAEGINDNKQYLSQNKIDITGYMKGRQLLDFKHFAVEMTYINEKRIEYTGYAVVDHHIGMIPDSLVLFVVKEMAKHVFNKLFKQLQKFEQTVWAKQMKNNYQQNRNFYDWIDNFLKVWTAETVQKK